MIIACIPAYNEEKTIAKMVLLTKREVDEVIVCDDGSEDLTSSLAEAVGAQVIRHSKNMGKGAAIRNLFNYSMKNGADIIVTLDADGQHDPSEISKLIAPIQNDEADVVIGSRFKKGNRISMPRYRRIGNKLLNFLTNVTVNGKISDTQSGYRAYSRKALEEIEVSENGIGVDSQILLEAKEKRLRIVERSIGCNYDQVESTYNPIEHVAIVILGLIRVVTEKRPFVYLGIPSAILLTIGMLLSVLLLNAYLTVGEFNMINAFFSMGSLLIGLLLAVAAIILNAIRRLKTQ